jgi:glycosyltransferase involved in cell wall biosynthesis
LFDLTTTAQWRGPAVGIVRVEGELAARARNHLGDDVAFCLYDRARSAVLVLDDSAADEIITGHLRVSLVRSSKIDRRDRNSLRSKLRIALLRNAAAYRLYQRLRGRSVSQEQVRQLQEAEFAPSTLTDNAATSSSSPEPVPLASVPHHLARLDADTTIISGGLDWQYKDLRALWALKKTSGFSYCTIVHDLIPVRFPQFVSSGYPELLTDFFGELLWLADRSICNSESTRHAWISHAHNLGLEPPPSQVFTEGYDLTHATHLNEQNAILRPQLQNKRFALYVSTMEPRKNHRMLYEAWDECMRAGHVDATRDRLVFVGRRGWAMEDLFHEIRTNPLTRDTIILLHDASDTELVLLYKACAFVVFPSLFEGFGLPLAEALGYGKLCVSSNAGALAEIGGDLVMRIDPKDTLAWASTIARLMTNRAEIDEWEARVRLAHHPVTWDDAAKSFFGAVVSPPAPSVDAGI